MRAAPRNAIRLALLSGVLGASALSCRPTPVGLVFSVDRATLPATATRLSVTVSVNDVQYQKADYDLPLSSAKDKLLFGLQLPDDTSGQLSATVYPVTVSDQRISYCGAEYKWTTNTALEKGTTQLDVTFPAPDGAFKNTNDLYAAWSDVDLFVAGAGGTMLRYDGSCWLRDPSPLLKPEYTFRALWGLSDDDVWVMGETTEGGTKKNVLLSHVAGTWTLRGELPGTLTGMWGLNSPEANARIWFIGHTGVTPYVYYHLKTPGNTAMVQVPVASAFSVGTGESIQDLTAVTGDGDSMYVAATVKNSGGTLYLAVFKLNETAPKPFNKILNTDVPSPTFTIDAMGTYPSEKMWLAGAKSAATTMPASQVALKVLDFATGQYVTAAMVPDPGLDKPTSRIVAINRSVSYLARIDPAAPPSVPLVRCELGNKCVTFGTVGNHFRGSVTSLWRTNPGEVWVTMTKGGLARIDTQNGETITSFWAP
ncbi:MAG: hypothetical protein U1A78_08900 [Polyangia bacterium]